MAHAARVDEYSRNIQFFFGRLGFMAYVLEEYWRDGDKAPPVSVGSVGLVSNDYVFVG